MMIGVAGVTAEYAWEDLRFGRDDFLSDLLYDHDAMSITDWAICECVPGDPTNKLLRCLDDAVELMNPNDGPLWGALCRKARLLLIEARPFEHMAAEAAAA